MHVLDIFSGIGGFSLGLERAGMRTVAFCEADPFCRAVLAKHWPNVPCYDDVRTLSAARLAADGIAVDVICGGFPCQDISFAGKGAGLAGERSGLWYEFHRLIEEIRPRCAIIENVSALRSRGLDAVLGSLAAIGYDAEWHCIPASAVGAPHRRDRIWIVAYRNADDESQSVIAVNDEARRVSSDGAVADTQSQRVEGRRPVREPQSRISITEGLLGRHRAACRAAHWEVEPGVGRVADGVPARVDRLKALGNAVVPQIPEMIGRAILRNHK
jgi:DNA (cytosine-5)-methyltransferase 1